MVKTNVHTVSTHNKGMQNGNVTWRAMLQRNNIRPGDDKQCVVKLRRVEIKRLRTQCSIGMNNYFYMKINIADY